MNDPVSIIVPIYNEEDCIEKTVQQIRYKFNESNIPFELILVNDGSSDSSEEIIKRFTWPEIIKISHPHNRGYGAALKSGILVAGNEYIMIIDSDGTYPLDNIVDLVNHTKDFDMVVGARNGKVVEIPFIRKPAKLVINKLANYLTGTKIPDLNSGLRIMHKEVVKNFLHLLPNGFSFTTTITLAMLINGYGVKYIPINYLKRIGKSKIRPISDTINFVLLILRTVLYFHPLKFFVPASLILFISGVALLFYRIYFEKFFGTIIVLLFVSSFQLLAVGMLADLIDKHFKRNYYGKHFLNSRNKQN